MIVHLNGHLIPLADAKISPFDRGFIFGDGVYEGLRSVPVGGPNEHAARMVGLGLHVRRMQSGLDEAGIRWDAAAIGPASLDLLRANALRDGFVYWQVTRGTPPTGEPVRSRAPARGSTMKPTVFGYCTPQPPLESVAEPPTKRAVVCRDIRWELGRLKSISLMGNVVTAIGADRAGADEAIMVREAKGVQVVSEGLATNVVIAVRKADKDEISTPSLDSAPILAGVTRAILIRMAPEIIERAIRPEELSEASEIMLIGTTTLVTSITHLDGRPIGEARPGPVAKRLLATLLDAIRSGRDEW